MLPPLKRSETSEKKHRKHRKLIEKHGKRLEHRPETAKPRAPQRLRSLLQLEDRPSPSPSPRRQLCAPLL